jgi:hypothetical protein
MKEARPTEQRAISGTARRREAYPNRTSHSVSTCVNREPTGPRRPCVKRALLGERRIEPLERSRDRPVASRRLADCPDLRPENRSSLGQFPIAGPSNGALWHSWDSCAMTVAGMGRLGYSRLKGPIELLESFDLKCSIVRLRRQIGMLPIQNLGQRVWLLLTHGAARRTIAMMSQRIPGLPGTGETG